MSLVSRQKINELELIMLSDSFIFVTRGGKTILTMKCSFRHVNKWYETNYFLRQKQIFAKKDKEPFTNGWFLTDLFPSL